MRTRMKAVTAFAASAALLAFSVPAYGANSTAEETFSPQHDVICVSTIGRPFAATSSAVGVFGEVECNYSPDIAVTTVQLQRIVNGAWTNYGNAVSSSSTAVYLSIYDGAGAPSGCHRFRGRIHREGFHGTWGYTTKSAHL